MIGTTSGRWSLLIFLKAILLMMAGDLQVNCNQATG